jgi:hypothetical protein
MRAASFVALSLLSTMWLTAQAGGQFEDWLVALDRCKAVRESGARLACYDATMAKREGTSAASASASAAATAGGQTGFGLPVQRVAPEPTMIESRVAGRLEGWSQGTRISLSNGQLWEVVDGSRATHYLDSPIVRVKRGLLGSYFMEIEGVSSTPRVRRIN